MALMDIKIFLVNNLSAFVRDFRDNKGSQLKLNSWW